MNKNKTSRSWYGFTSLRLCHYFTNITLNLANHANCVPETTNSIGRGCITITIKLYIPKCWTKQMVWSLGMNRQKRGRHSVLIIKKKNVNGGSKTSLDTKVFGELWILTDSWGHGIIGSDSVDERYSQRTTETQQSKRTKATGSNLIAMHREAVS